MQVVMPAMDLIRQTLIRNLLRANQCKQQHVLCGLRSSYLPLFLCRPL